MTLRHLVRFTRDLGWSDPPALSSPPPDLPRPDGASAGNLDLRALAAAADACTSCQLSKARHRVVFGEGSPTAAVMLVGEGPGAEEDQTGRPFVGQAGRLLEAMLLAIGLVRDQVYITNVVKCRPPGNRDPAEDEVAACAHFLDQQIELLRPRVILALGKPALRRLTGSTEPMGAVRGRWSSYRGTPVLPTYHPAYFLRSPQDKRLAWEDLKAIRAKLG